MQHGPAASSGSNPKAPGSAGGYLLAAGQAGTPMRRKGLDVSRCVVLDPP
jgi:hypothetical protein